jgi:thiol-disulfide isomerase/thioredoxin
MRRLGLTVIAVAIALSAMPAARGNDRKADAVSGQWDAALKIPSGEVAFVLDLELRGDAVRGGILNGPDRLELSSGTFDGTTLVLRLDYYDGQITARFEDAPQTTLVGEYTRQTRSGIGKYEFTASRRPKPAARPAGPVAKALDISGDWVMTLRDASGKATQVDEATFAVAPLAPGVAAVTGTVIPVSGDYGLLNGTITQEGGTRFRMSRFDGIHVTLLTGELRADGTMAGELASGASYRTAWTAVRKGAAAAGAEGPKDPFTLTSVRDANEPFAFSLPGVDGKLVSLSDERFRGKVVLVDIFGTWCPNCHDAAPLLVDLYKRYHRKGLEIVSLAYEYTEDKPRNARQIEIFRRKYGVPFPILMAGTTNEGEIARTLPQLVNFGAYPTTIFVGRDGRVRKIHAGFAGPATGERYVEVKREFENLVRELLAEKH